MRLADDNLNVEIAAVNCASEQHLCGRQGVHAFPTIKLYAPAADPEEPGAGAAKASGGAQGRAHTHSYVCLGATGVIGSSVRPDSAQPQPSLNPAST